MLIKLSKSERNEKHKMKDVASALKQAMHMNDYITQRLIDHNPNLNVQL